MNKGYILLMTAIVLSTLASAKSYDIDRTTVSDIDLKRYMGRWFEIARFDHSFERNLDYCEAFYALQDDGTISVTNTGLNSRTEKRKTAYGKAKLGERPGQLRVSFFWFFYSDYNILALSQEYEWALIGSKSERYLWILSRTRHLDSNTRNNIVAIAQSRGYDTSKLIWVKQ